jgi:hypothetical protein
MSSPNRTAPLSLSFDPEPVLFTGEWGGTARAISVAHRLIEHRAGRSLNRRDAIAFVYENAAHFIEEAKHLCVGPAARSLLVKLDIVHEEASAVAA